MQINDAGLAILKRFEGFRAEPYLDPVGVKTVGYGHCVLPGENFTTITEAEATGLLLRDADLRGRWVLEEITAPLNQNQFSALVSLVYNVGTGPLHGTLAALLNESHYADAADQFLKWDHAAHRQLAGLTRRREAERALFLTEG